MSRLDEIKNQLKEKFSEIFEKLKETELYQKADEKYQSLTPRGQKLTRYASAFLLVFFIIIYPVSQLQMSSDLVAQFEVKRELLRDLFKTYRESSASPVLPSPPQGSELISQVQSMLSTAQLLPEQIVNVGLVESAGHLIPQKLVNSVVAVQLSRLNLRQTVDIGTQLANISASIKVKDLDMTATEGKAGYFDVTYKLYAFNVPQAIAEAAPDIEVPNKGKKKKASDEISPADGGGLKE
ncbi:MAG: hypothetical protein H7Z71_08465 [Moraxellaceae bacterium]|nr:hypothetical protein [Pseudobdellovibrionaceae bacterium]